MIIISLWVMIIIIVKLGGGMRPGCGEGERPVERAGATDSCVCVYIYIYIYTHTQCTYIMCSHIAIHHITLCCIVLHSVCSVTDRLSLLSSCPLPHYGQFSKYNVCFCGLDPGNLNFETVRTHKQHVCF